MHDHSPPSIGHWAMVRALLTILLFNALALGIFIASYLAYVRRPHPASFILCMVMPLLLLLLLALQNRQRRRLGLTWADIGFHQPQRSMWQLLWQIPAALLLLVLAYKTCLLMIEPLPDDPIFKPLAPWWFFAASAALLIPLTEEIAFRGLFFYYLQARCGYWGLLGWSSLLFALGHMGPGLLPLLPYYLLLGLLFGLIRLHHHNLWASVALHTVVNLGVVLFTLLGVY